MAEWSGRSTTNRTSTSSGPQHGSAWVRGSAAAVFLLALIAPYALLCSDDSGNWTAPATHYTPGRVRFAVVKARYFRARVPYDTNGTASRQLGRFSFVPALLLAGDVELNPGPEQRSERASSAPESRRGNLSTVTALTQNVRSVRNKLHTLRSHAGELQRFDVVSLTETWLSPDVSDSELQHGWSNHV